MQLWGLKASFIKIQNGTQSFAIENKLTIIQQK